MWSRKRLLALFTGLLAASLLWVGAYYYGKSAGFDEGVLKGVDKYHQACYTGGIIINPVDRTIVMCRPLGVLPKEEQENFVKKSLTNT